VAGGGAKQELLGTIKRYNGVLQATYNGHPLYYYTGNGKTIEGDTSTANGQGVTAYGARWWVLDVNGNKVTATGGDHPGMCRQGSLTPGGTSPGPAARPRQG
jgi:hypothetical protein